MFLSSLIDADRRQWRIDLLLRQRNRVMACVDGLDATVEKHDWPETVPRENVLLELKGQTLQVRELLEEDLNPDPDESPEGFDWWCPRCPRGFGDQDLSALWGDCYTDGVLVCRFCGAPVVDAGQVAP